MIRTFAPALAIAAMAIPVPAQACTYAQRPEAVGYASGEYFAKVMSQEATYVDLVLVEDDGVRSRGAQPTGILTLRTIARLKGNSADRFTLFGTGLTLSPEAERMSAARLQHFTSETGQVTPFPYNEERPLRLLPSAVDGAATPPPPPMTSCSPPQIAGQTGKFYVVMRDAEGRLLDRIALSDGTSVQRNHAAFGFVPATLEEEAYWLWSVRMATSGEQDASGPMLLHLAPGSDGAVAEQQIRAAGANVRAAYYDRGGFIEEVRPAPFEQSNPWLARSASYLAGSRQGRIGVPYHGGAEYLRTHLTPLQQYGTGLAYEVAQAFTNSVRQFGDASGEPRLIALEIDGDPQAFAGEAFVERVARLDVAADGLPRLAGEDDAAIFATRQRLERDISLLNGGAGNPQGTLP